MMAQSARMMSNRERGEEGAENTSYGESFA